jgi:pimeloyl-ACP methyl ester carboxylesterase
MITTPTPAQNSITLLIALVTIGLAIAASACGGASADRSATRPSSTTAPATTTTTTVVTRPTEPRDEIVATAAGRLHIHCKGDGPTTVLLIAGWDAGGDESWAAVQPKIAARDRVCTYDRFGTGTSDAASKAQTFTTQAADFHALLDAAGEPGPYVVAGHSFGGAEAVAFASRYQDDVVGLLLIDASPPTWPAAVCAVPDDGSEAATDARKLCAVFHDPASDAERLDAVAAFDEVAAIDSLDDLPVTVMTAAHRTWPGLAARELTRLDAVWAEGVSRWAALSANSTTLTVEKTGHYIQIEHPDVVVNALTQLLPESNS